MYIKLRSTLFILAAVLALAAALAVSAPALAAENDGTAPYRVLHGDTLTKIAARFGLSVENLLLANPQIKDPNLILTGQVITLPAGRSEGLPAAAPKGRLIHWQLERAGRVIDRSEHFYLVRSGDTLTGIARKYGVTLEKLLSVNPQIEDPNILFRGELVKIPDGRSETAPPFYQTPPKPPTG